MKKNYTCKRNIQFTAVSDYGNDPFVVDIRRLTEQNNNFRSTLWTGTYMQLTLMSIEPGSAIGLEIHPDTDQFLCVAQGVGRVLMGKSKEILNYQQNIRDGFSILVPAGMWHNIINIGKIPLKLSSIYAPPHHPRGTVHKTKADSDASEEELQG